jgi:predicted NBD/HSP70 family sugar kinase
MKSSSKANSIKRSVKTARSTSPSSRKHTGNGRGRFRSSKGQGLVVGVDIGGSNLRVAFADIQGNVLGKWSTSTRATSSPEMVVAQIEEGVESLLKQSNSSGGSLLGIAAGAPGVTDPKAGVVLATSYLRGWKNVPFQHLLESALGVPAAVENDVRMAALGEHWLGAARGVDDFVFMAIGTGIAAGIFANGKLIHGVNCAAGEVGYMYVPGATEMPAQPGAAGSLESVIGGDGIGQQWLKVSQANGRSDTLNASEIFARASCGDLLAQSVLDRSAQFLAYAVYNISLVLNSSLFVLGGGVGSNVPLRDATERILQQYKEPSCPKVVVSHLGTDAQLMGAIRLALTAAETHAKRRD